jgi:hypothetical protein
MLLTLLVNNQMVKQNPSPTKGGYVRQGFDEEIEKDERLKRLRKDDEILLMAIKAFVENL